MITLQSVMKGLWEKQEREKQKEKEKEKDNK